MQKNKLILLLILLPASSIALETWWNQSFQYRFQVNASTGSLSRQDAPIELTVNFTNLLLQLNDSNGFDENSVRVIESGSQLPSQYYDASPIGDGYGEIVFLLNGSTSSSTTRTFYVYFDTNNNSKNSPSYSSSWGSINTGANSIENSLLKTTLGSADIYTGINDFIIKSESNQDQSNNAVAVNARVEGLYLNDNNNYAAPTWSSIILEDGPVRKTLRLTGVQNPYTVYEEVSVYDKSPFIKIYRSSSTATNYRVLGLGTPGGDASSEADDSTTNSTSNNYYYRGVYDDANLNGYGIVINQSIVQANSWSVFEGLNRYGWNFSTTGTNQSYYMFYVTNGSSDVSSWGQLLSNPLNLVTGSPENRIACSSNNDCNDSNPCTLDTCDNPGIESAVCSYSQTAYCVNSDGLCCSSCNKNSDNDCTASCGNGVCEAPGENTYTCPSDCSAVCGNDVCESSENQCLCPEDCGVCGGSCGSCLSFQCTDYSCVCGVTQNCCGNDICEPPSENSTSCANDCSGLQIIVLKPANNSAYSINDNLSVEVLVKRSNTPVNASKTTLSLGFQTKTLTMLENNTPGYYLASIITPSNTLGVYSLIISSEDNGSIGNKYLEFNVSKTLRVKLETSASTYDIGGNILITGKVTTLSGASRPGADVTLTLKNEASNWKVSLTTLTNSSGEFSTVYETTFADPPGSWIVEAAAQDIAGNTASTTVGLAVALPSKFSYFTVKFSKPTRGTSFQRGSSVPISVELFKEGEIVTGANVTAVTPNGLRIQLLEKQSGIYEGAYTIPLDALEGDFNLMVEARKEVSNSLRGGGDFVTLGVLPIEVSVKIISPTQTTFSKGETVNFVIAATYPDGSSVKFGNATVKDFNGKLLTLQETGLQTYVLDHKLSGNESGTWGALITVTDPDGNFGSTVLTLFVKEGGLYLDFYELILLAATIIAAITIFAKLFGLKAFNKFMLKRWKTRETHLNSMLEATQKKYFERRIDEETYFNLVRKYEGELVGVQSRIRDLKQKLGLKGKSKKRVNRKK